MVARLAAGPVLALVLTGPAAAQPAYVPSSGGAPAVPMPQFAPGNRTPTGIEHHSSVHVLEGNLETATGKGARKVRVLPVHGEDLPPHVEVAGEAQVRASGSAGSAGSTEPTAAAPGCSYDPFRDRWYGDCEILGEGAELEADLPVASTGTVRSTGRVDDPGEGGPGKRATEYDRYAADREVEAHDEALVRSVLDGLFDP